MKIWQWGYESDRYESFTFPNPKEFNQYFDPYFNGMVIGDKWGRVRFETYHHGTACDCTGVGSNYPIFSDHAIQVLAPYLNSNVELLPLQHPTKNFYAVNVTRLIDGLDFEHSDIEYIEGHPNFVKNVNKYAFKYEVIRDYSIFKIPEYKRRRVYVSDTFKEAVEANRLKGFTFELLWDSEARGDEEEELERSYQERLAAVERNKGEEFSFEEAEYRMDAGEGLASGQWRLQKTVDGKVRLGRLQADGSYNWIQPVYYPPVLLDLKWHVVNTLPVE